MSTDVVSEFVHFHVQSGHVSISISLHVCIAIVVTIGAVVIPTLLFWRWRLLNLLSKQDSQIKDLEQQFEQMESDWYGEVEKSTHLEEELRVVDQELLQLRRDVEHHNRYCPLGRQITRSRFGSRWHQDPNCQHLRQVDRDRIEHIYHCSTCSHARPMFSRNI